MGHRRRLWASLGVVGTMVAIAGFRYAQARTGHEAEAAAAGAATGLLKGPYLQSLGATGVTVKAELPAAAAARVEVYAPAETKPILAVEGSGDRAFHAIRVDGLQPATPYEYVVSAG